jgi:hypothetical protein
MKKPLLRVAVPYPGHHSLAAKDVNNLPALQKNRKRLRAKPNQAKMKRKPFLGLCATPIRVSKTSKEGL